MVDVDSTRSGAVGRDLHSATCTDKFIECGLQKTGLTFEFAQHGGDAVKLVLSSQQFDILRQPDHRLCTETAGSALQGR